MSNSDYLWNKTGEPDPDIQELEEILSVLRYRPKPLLIPLSVPRSRRSFFYPGLALAASIALLLFGLALWRTFNQIRQQNRGLNATSQPNKEIPQPVAPSNNPSAKEEVAIRELPTNNAQLSVHSSPRSTTQTRRPRFSTGHASELTSLQRIEAERAKQQLFVALRLASAKLNAAQKRIQPTSPANLIRNQHKIG